MERRGSFTHGGWTNEGCEVNDEREPSVSRMGRRQSEKVCFLFYFLLIFN